MLYKDSVIEFAREGYVQFVTDEGAVPIGRFDGAGHWRLYADNPELDDDDAYALLVEAVKDGELDEFDDWIDYGFGPAFLCAGLALKDEDGWFSATAEWGILRGEI